MTTFIFIILCLQILFTIAACACAVFDEGENNVASVCGVLGILGLGINSFLIAASLHPVMFVIWAWCSIGFMVVTGIFAKRKKELQALQEKQERLEREYAAKRRQEEEEYRLIMGLNRGSRGKGGRKEDWWLDYYEQQLSKYKSCSSRKRSRPPDRLYTPPDADSIWDGVDSEEN